MDPLTLVDDRTPTILFLQVYLGRPSKCRVHACLCKFILLKIYLQALATPHKSHLLDSTLTSAMNTHACSRYLLGLPKNTCRNGFLGVRSSMSARGPMRGLTKIHENLNDAHGWIIGRSWTFENAGEIFLSIFLLQQFLHKKNNILIYKKTL